MDWHECLSNPDGLSRIYENAIPDLVEVQLHKIEVDRDGPSVVLHLDLPEYPANPPSKWTTSGCNTVRVELCLVGVEDLCIEGISTEMCVDIHLHKEEGAALTVDVRSLGMTATMTAAACAVLRISAYQNDIN